MSEMEQKPQSSIEAVKTVENRYNDPKTGKFIPGNPGRPLGTRNFETTWNEAIKDIAELNNITPQEAEKVLIKKAWSEAKSGKYPFYKDILDRLYGSAPIKHEFDEDKPLNVIIRKWD